MVANRRGRGQGVRVREVTRARLLETAEAMFLAGGYAETSLDAIAHAAGYTTGAVYSNFGGKADLFLAVLESTTALELAAVREQLAAAATDDQRLRVFTATIVAEPDRWRARVAATIEFIGEARHQPALLERIRAAQAEADAVIGAILVALSRALDIVPRDDMTAATRDVTALLNGYAIRSLYDDSFDLAGAVAGAIKSLMVGHRAELVGSSR